MCQNLSHAMLSHCTGEKGNFLTIAVNEPSNEKYRKNFTEILNPDSF